jgi:putative transposase
VAEALGAQAALSKSTVSRVCEAIKTEFDAWKKRDLSGLVLDYLYDDATFFKMHPNAGGEPVLCAWGITTEGRKVLVGLTPGAAESYDAWKGFFEDLRARGLATPLLGITDGNAGLIRAYEEVFPGSLRQRCVVHKARNTIAKVPKAAQGEVKAAYWSIFDDITAAPGDAAVAEAVRRAQAFEKQYRDLYPSAVSCVLNDIDSLTTHLRFPPEHWERVRHTNLLERTFGETRRRSKVIGRLPGERSCLSLVWAVLDRSSKGWRGLEQTPAGIRLLQDLRRQLLSPSLHASIDQNVDREKAA